MASKGEVGLDVDVALVPLREDGLEPFEIMVSESQERMLCVATPTGVDEVLAVCEKWEVYGSPFGVVTDTGHFRIFDGGALVGDMPVPALVDDCPLYDIYPEKPAEPLYPAPPRRVADDLDARRGADRAARLAEPRRPPPLFQQYDPSCSRARCAARAGRRRRARSCPARPARIAASIDGSGRRVAADPYQGTV